MARGRNNRNRGLQEADEAMGIGVEEPADDGHGLNGGLRDQLGEVHVNGAMTSGDLDGEVPDMAKIVAAHATAVDDVPRFRERLGQLLAFVAQYMTADASSQETARTAWENITARVRRSLFDNTSAVSRQAAWEMVLVHKFQRTFGSLAEIATYLRELCDAGYLVVSKQKGTIWVFEEARYDSRERRIVDAQEVGYDLPVLANLTPEQAQLVVKAYHAMIARAGIESRKRWKAALPAFVAKWQGGITPDQYAEREIGHCLFQVPSQGSMEGGWLVMQSRADADGRGMVHSFVADFLNDATDRCVGKFESAMRAITLIRPPVFIDPAWARAFKGDDGKKVYGCPKLGGSPEKERIGRARWQLSVNVQRGFEAWAEEPDGSGASQGQGGEDPPNKPE